MAMIMKQSSRVIALTFMLCFVSFIASCNANSDKKEMVVWNVQVAKVTTADIPQYIDALGSLSAMKAVTISPVVDGKISKIFFSNGQTVSEGDVIAQLDSQQAQAQFNKAQAVYVSEQQKYERYKQLSAQEIGNISRQELDDQRANLETAKADQEEKKADLDQLSIKAPFSGILGEFKYNEGDYITAGTVLVDLVNKSRLLADYNIPQSYLTQLKKGQRATIRVKALPNQSFTGTVNFISPTIDDSTRTVTVQALVPNPDDKLLPGMFVKVHQQIGTEKNVLVVPDQAVLADVKGYYVYRVVDNKATQVYIELGTRQGGLAQVKSGIKVGDTIVVLGQQKLQDGSAVNIITATDKTSDTNTGQSSAAPLTEHMSSQDESSTNQPSTNTSS